MRRDNHLAGLAIGYAQRFIGLPYRWGGDDPLEGFDCSGLVIEVLKSVGLLGRRYDATAAQLFKVFPPATGPHPGCLAFWSSSRVDRIVHVEIVINSDQTLGASGGGRHTSSTARAADHNAYIKIRPIGWRQPQAPMLTDPFAVVAA